VLRKVNALGVSTEDLRLHIAWDIGAAAVAVTLAAPLDAFLILPTYSRFIIDCNRPPEAQNQLCDWAISTRSPGNESVSAIDALALERAVFRPYRDRICS